jgi:hypothetical protein
VPAGFVVGFNCATVTQEAAAEETATISPSGCLPSSAEATIGINDSISTTAITTAKIFFIFSPYSYLFIFSFPLPTVAMFGRYYTCRPQV